MSKALALLLALLFVGAANAQPSIRLIDSAKKAWMPDGKGTVGLRFRNAGNQPLIVTAGTIRSKANVFDLLTSFTTPKIVQPGDSSYVTVVVDAVIAYEYFANVDLVSNDPQRPLASFALRVNDSIPPNPVKGLEVTPLKDGYLSVSWQAPPTSRDADSIVFYRSFVIAKNGDAEEIYSGKGRSVTAKSKFEGDVYVSVLAYDDMGNRSVMMDTTWADWSVPYVALRNVDQQFAGVPEHIERGNPRFELDIRDWHIASVSAYWREPGSQTLNPITSGNNFSPIKEDHIFGFHWNTSNLRGEIELVLISRDLVDNSDTSVYRFTVSQNKGWPKRMFNHPVASSSLIGGDEGGRFVIAGADIANGVFRTNGHHYFYNWPHDITRPLINNVILSSADFDKDNRSEVIALTQSDQVLIMDHHGETERQFGEVTFNERYASVVAEGDSVFIMAGASPVAIRNETGSYLMFGGSQSWRPSGVDAGLERILPVDGVREKDRFVIGNVLDPDKESLIHIHDNGQYEEFSIRSTFGKLEAGPFVIWQPTASYTGFYPSLGDIDADGDLEIVIPAANDSVYAFHHTGILVNGYPVHAMSSFSGRNQAMLVDVNADGASDIIFPVNDSIIAIDGKRATLIHDNVWPIKRDAQGAGLITIADLNSDGYLELIEPPSPGDTSWFYVYDINAVNKPGTIEWGTFQHDMMRTGNYNTPVKALQSKVAQDKARPGSWLSGKTLRVSNPARIEVLDLLGRVVVNSQDSDSVDLRDLANGVYFVRIDELEIIKIVL